MAGRVDSDDEVMSDINITPFVDVVLVLLIILMVTSVDIVKASLIVKLPKAASGKSHHVDAQLGDHRGLNALPRWGKTTEEALIAKTQAEAAKTPTSRP